jgi:hypothetical protein
MISLRKSYETAAIKPGLLSAGLRAWSKAGLDAFPFSSIRLLCNAFHWPRQFTYTSEWPSEIYVPQGPNESWNWETQGISRDENYWYLNTADALWYFPAPVPVKPLPAGQEAIVENDGVCFRGRRQLVDVEAEQGPKHLSAPARHGKLLLVPAEGNPMPEEEFLWVWVFSMDTLGYLGRIAVEVPQKWSFSWCAVSQDGRLMYTSGWDDHSISVYRLPDLREFIINPTTGLPIQPSNKMAIESYNDSYYPSLKSKLIGRLRMLDPGGGIVFKEIQGGCVSPNGHLYISFQKVWKGGSIEDCKGVLGLDLLTGQVVHFISSDRGDEIEGVFVETDGVHVLHDKNNYFRSNQFTISHYMADSADA